MAVAQDIPSYDPFLLGADSAPILRNIYESLVDYDRQIRPVPRLAKGWKVSSDHRSVDVTLRQGVKFHNGHPLTAEAVVKNYRRAQNKATAGHLGGAVADLKTVAAVDDSTVRFTFEQPKPDQAITDELQAVPIADPATFDKVKSTGVGTGPWTQGSRIPGQQYTLKRFDGYWGPKPAVATTEFKVIADPEAKVAALEAGQIDVITSPNYSSLPRLRDRFNVVDNPSAAGTMVMWINARVPALSNELVRQAFNYAINRQAITKTALFGFGQPKVLPWARTSPAYDVQLASRYAFDLSKAKQLFVQGGQANLSVRVTVPNGLPEFKAAAQVVQADLAKIGVHLTVVPQDLAQFLEEQTNGTSQLSIGGTGFENKYPTALASLPFFAVGNNPIAPGGKPPKYYIDAFAAADAALTPQAQQQAFREINNAYMQWATGIVLAQRPVPYVYSKRVTGVDSTIDAQLLLRQVAFINQ